MGWASISGWQSARDAANCPDSFATPERFRRPFLGGGHAEAVAVSLTAGGARLRLGKNGVVAFLSSSAAQNRKRHALTQFITNREAAVYVTLRGHIDLSRRC